MGALQNNLAANSRERTRIWKTLQKKTNPIGFAITRDLGDHHSVAGVFVLAKLCAA
jgi:hypothetical protein